MASTRYLRVSPAAMKSNMFCKQEFVAKQAAYKRNNTKLFGLLFKHLYLAAYLFWRN